MTEKQSPGASASPRRIQGEKLKTLLSAISDPIRLQILDELMKGEALPVKEIGKRIGLPMTNTSKHVLRLFNAGIIERRYNRAYLVSAPYIAPEGKVLRLGPITIDLAGIAFR